MNYNVARVIAESQATTNASPTADLVIGAIAILLGGTLVADVRNISATLRKNSTGFTPWGRRIAGRGPNPVRIVGFGFLVCGLITLGLGLVRAA